MIERKITPELLALAAQYPIVTIIGPRQSGKTTLVKQAFPGYAYLNLEDPETRLLAESDPKALFSRYSSNLILDEIQRVPTLLSYLQIKVDEDKRKGQFILTGSHQLQLQQAISQSLAGRTALLTLYPLSLAELKTQELNYTIDDYIFHGFYPRIYHDHLNPTKAYRNYFQTYVERDVRQLIHVKDLSLFEKFLKLCAGRVGQVFNIHSLSNEVGVANHTLKHWISILEASFVIFKLHPYYENIGKRLIKSPKLYFVDPGLAAYLIDIESSEQLSRDPLRGNLFENMVVVELMKARLNAGLDPHIYFYRDNNQREIDVIFKSGHELLPIEIKSSQTLHLSFLKSLYFFKQLVDDRMSKGFVIYGGSSQQVKEMTFFNYLNAGEVLANTR